MEITEVENDNEAETRLDGLATNATKRQNPFEVEISEITAVKSGASATPSLSDRNRKHFPSCFRSEDREEVGGRVTIE